MGEDDAALHYDEEMIFKHLCGILNYDGLLLLKISSCFFLDTPVSAEKLGMSVRSKHSEQIVAGYNYDLLWLEASFDYPQ